MMGTEATGSLYRWLFGSVSVSASLLIVFFGTTVPGLEMLFLLPLAFAVASLLAGNIFSLWQESIGYFVLFLVLLLRYLGSPLLIAFSGQTVDTITASPSAMRSAVFIMCAELFVVIGTIWRMQRKVKLVKFRDALSVKSRYQNSKHGFVVLALIALVLVVRGNLANVVSHKSFAVWTSTDRSTLSTYDLEMLLVLKACLLVAVAVWAGQVLAGKPTFWQRVVSTMAILIAAFANALWYFHPNRSVMVYTIISSVAVLMFVFPKNKRWIMVSGVVVAVVLAGSNVARQTLQVGRLPKMAKEIEMQRALQVQPEELEQMKTASEDLPHSILEQAPITFDSFETADVGGVANKASPRTAVVQESSDIVMAPASEMAEGDAVIKARETKQEATVFEAALVRMSKIGELYSNGISTMAHAHEVAESIHRQVEFGTVLHDGIRYLRFVSYPVFRRVLGWFSDYPTTASLFSRSLGELPYIMPNYGLAVFYAEKTVGFLLDLGFHALIVIAIEFFRRLRQRTNHAGYLYAFTYAEAICGTAVLNNIGLMIWQISGYPLLIFLVFWLIGLTQRWLPKHKASS